MIYESWPWKQDLAKRAASLRKRKKQRRWPEASLFLVERDVFLLAYAVRKLLDAKKISDEVESSSIPAREYKAVKPPVDFLDRRTIDEQYELTSPKSIRVSLRHFCNQIIHSFLFVPKLNDPGLAGFYVASDTERARHLLFFDADDVVDAIKRVADDYVVSASVERDSKTGKIVKLRKSNKHLP